MNTPIGSTTTERSTSGWLGAALLLSLLVLAGCNQSQPQSTGNPVSAPTPIVAEAQPTATQPAAATAQSAPAGEAQPTATQSAATQEEPAVATGDMIVKLNLNTATNDQFSTIPNVGDRMLREFNEYRPYASILQFRKEMGKYIDDAQIAAYEEYLFVPIDPNSSDTATLQQIPGVDEALAAALIEARPYASHATFAEKLAATLTPEQVAVADSYLVAQ